MPTTRREIEDADARTRREAEKAHESIMQAVAALQGEAAKSIFEWVEARIDVGEDGKITYNAKNLSRVQGLAGILRRFQKRFEGTILARIIGWADRLLNSRHDYFEETAKANDDIKTAARRLALRRWGYNTDTGKLIPGGYLETVFKGSNIGQQIAAYVNRAIATGMSLPKFRQTFRKAFTGPGGVLFRHYKTHTFDLFQRIDRAAALVYADRLDLNYAVYSGTLEKDSRPFCIARVNKVFSRAQIQSWQSLSFQGKPKIGYDPFLDCGGFNCRHHLSFISDVTAEHLLKEQIK